MDPEPFIRRLLDHTRKGWVVWRGKWDDRTCVEDGTTVVVTVAGWRWSVVARDRAGGEWKVSADDARTDHLEPLVLELFAAAT